MRLIAYVSKYQGNEEALLDVLSSIKESSTLNNQAAGITGALLYHDGNFIQVLEGEPDNLQPLLDKIKKDQRHDNFQVFINEQVTGRSLTTWDMDCLNLNDLKDVEPASVEEFASQYRKMFELNASDFLTYLKHVLSKF